MSTPVRDYLQTLPEPERAAYERVLAAARRQVPEAEEGMSYGMPALLLHGRPLLGIKAATTHLGTVFTNRWSFGGVATAIETASGSLAIR